MKKELPKGLVAVPVPTLNALKNILFSAEGTIDISPIADDLAVSEDHRDVLAINIALVMKGMKPEIGKFRYKKDGFLFITWELTHFSLISGIVTVKVSAMRYNPEAGTFTEYNGILKENNIDYSEWAEASADKQEVLDRFK